MWSRWLGVGLAAILAVVTLSLTITGRLQLYINPAQAWFACGMAVLILIGTVASFALRPGEEHDDHDHDHGPVSRAGLVATVVGGSVATLVVVAALVLPPAALSAELAMERDTGASPLFAGADDVELGIVDTSGFGVGDWSATFATATSPERYEGETVALTGFITADDSGSANLTRLVITHCVIDAQSASLPVGEGLPDGLETGQWIELTGEIVVAEDGLAIQATGVEEIAEPEDPYEY